MPNRKEVKTMKYETPEVTVLTSAIDAIQSSSKSLTIGFDGGNETVPGYADWEE